MRFMKMPSFSNLLYVLSFALLTLPSTTAVWTQNSVYVLGFSIIPSEVRKKTYFDSSRRLYAQENTETMMRFFGKFTQNTFISFNLKPTCDKASSNTQEYKVQIIPESDSTCGEIKLVLPRTSKMQELNYLCLRESSWPLPIVQGDYVNAQGAQEIHQWLTIMLLKTILPLWSHIIFIIILLSLSSLFSGLNLGLLSLDKTDLKIIINTGSPKERQEALKIVAVRNHGNYLLCSLLLSNVLVNTILTLTMDEVFGGNTATIAVTTLAIVIFGEITPQAVCSRYGLTVGAKTIWITKMFMFATFPLAYPVGRLLDKLLGEDIGAVYTRDRLKELLKVTRDQHGLENEEVEIIAGALDMKTKTVKEVMTPIQEMFMVPYEAVLNAKLLTDIENKGYTRIPIYHGERQNVVGVLNVKQLTLVDPSKNIPVKEQIDMQKAHLFCVFENTPLDFMLKEFREGSKGHMAFVQRTIEEGPGDPNPKFETIGLITLEDVLEELLQQEIYDENDIVHGRTAATNIHPSTSLPLFDSSSTQASSSQDKTSKLKW